MRRLAILAALAVTAVGVTACADTNSAVTKESVPASVRGAVEKAEVVKPKPTATAGQRNALASAKDYLSFQAFSKKGLIEQLSSDAGEGFARADARWAAAHVHADWRAQAVKAARSYLDMQSFSRQGLIEQLSSDAGEGFTLAQAQHGVKVAYR